MAAQISQQYSYRAQKALGLVGGTPDYVDLAGFESPDTPVKAYSYSSDGRLYAYALANVVRIFQAELAQLVVELPIPNVVELNFSPRGTYISTWERTGKNEDGSQFKNTRVFSASTGEELISFTQKSQDGWDLQYTISESHAIRLVGADIQVYKPAEWSKGIVDKLKVEGATSLSLSPGLNPSVAVFIAEKKGAPASIKIYGLLSLNSPPTCQKTFFKADRAQIKWNTLGTQVLLLTTTEVDKSNKSYYGETGMYLLSAAGNFDCRVTLDKEGPIHDFAWSPNSKEFGVVYGYMPAKTMLFDQRVRTLHDFGPAPHNFISFNPQGRLVALAGFGNLAGKIDVFDRRTLNKVCTIDAPNTSFCEWSPDGRFLLTATLSPRLRVDNGIKIWHCTGPLMHIQAVEELYQTSWRPILLENCPQFGNVLPSPPTPTDAVKNMDATKKVAPSKPAGAYRPPGARGLATPAIFKREDEGGAARTPTNGTATPPRGYNRSPAPIQVNGQQHGHGSPVGNGRRHVPGAPHTPSPGADEDKKGGARKRNKGAKKGGAEGGTPQAPVSHPKENGVENVNGNGDSPASATLAKPNGNGKSNGRLVIDIEPPVLVADVMPTPVTPGLDSGLDPIAKKARNLNKKLKAIEELKDKSSRGERLEATQLKKIDGEADIRKELASLGISVT